MPTYELRTMDNIECEGKVWKKHTVIGQLTSDMPPDNVISLIRMNQIQLIRSETLAVEQATMAAQAEALKPQAKPEQKADGELTADELNELDRLEDEREAEEARRAAAAEAEATKARAGFEGLDVKIADALIKQGHTGLESLLEFLAPGDTSLTDIPGIGKKPAATLLKWIEKKQSESTQPAESST
jgi:hypothetical protein